MADLVQSELIASVRKFFMDLASENELNFQEEELSDELISEAIYDGLDLYNTSVMPVTIIATENIEPRGAPWAFIKRFATAEAIQRLVFQHVRNQNPVNDSGFQVDEYSKGPEWATVRANLLQEVKLDAERYKRQQQYGSFIATGVSLVP